MGFTHFSGVDAEQLKIDGTLLTVTAAELNAMSGGGLSAAELGYLDGATPGTQVASKAVIADANVNTGISKVTELHIGATGAETQVTSTAAELNLLDGSTAGTQVASKAVIADANINIGVTKVTELHIGATGAEIQVTATAAELNKNDVSAETETIDSGVAASATIGITKIDNTVTGAGAITLAAPDASMLGKTKIIEMVVDNGDVTLSLANVTGGSAATTCTWANVNEALILVGGTNKWHVVAESGVVLT